MTRILTHPHFGWKIAIKPIPPARPRRRSAPEDPAACGPKVAHVGRWTIFWSQKVAFGQQK